MEVYTKLQQYPFVTPENFMNSLDKIPSKILRDIQKFVSKKLSSNQAKKKMLLEK